MYTVIEINQHRESEFLEDEPLMEKVKEWHRRRDILKELLYLSNEESMLVQRIPNWERLKRESSYIQEGNYLTPFSFILDFVNPYHMVFNHGKELWQASFISQEFMDYLSFKYPEIKAFWKPD